MFPLLSSLSFPSSALRMTSTVLDVLVKMSGCLTLTFTSLLVVVYHFGNEISRKPRFLGKMAICCLFVKNASHATQASSNEIGT